MAMFSSNVSLRRITNLWDRLTHSPSVPSGSQLDLTTTAFGVGQNPRKWSKTRLKVPNPGSVTKLRRNADGRRLPALPEEASFIRHAITGVRADVRSMNIPRA